MSGRFPAGVDPAVQGPAGLPSLTRVTHDSPIPMDVAFERLVLGVVARTHRCLAMRNARNVVDARGPGGSNPLGYDGRSANAHGGPRCAVTHESDGRQMIDRALQLALQSAQPGPTRANATRR